MKKVENKPASLEKLSKAEIIVLVAEQIKGKVLFPKKVEEARRMLERARWRKK
jgi:hypothetical protein